MIGVGCKLCQSARHSGRMYRSSCNQLQASHFLIHSHFEPRADFELCRVTAGYLKVAVPETRAHQSNKQPQCSQCILGSGIRFRSWDKPDLCLLSRGSWLFFACLYACKQGVHEFNWQFNTDLRARSSSTLINPTNALHSSAVLYSCQTQLQGRHQARLLKLVDLSVDTPRPQLTPHVLHTVAVLFPVSLVAMVNCNSDAADAALHSYGGAQADASMQGQARETSESALTHQLQSPEHDEVRFLILWFMLNEGA